jgi:hypothetical protein
MPGAISRLSWRGVDWFVSSPSDGVLRLGSEPEVNGRLLSTARNAKGRVLYECRTDATASLAIAMAGVDCAGWTRSFVAVGDDFLVVEDKVTAKAGGRHDVSIHWVSPHPTSAQTAGTVQFHSGDVALTLVPASTSTIETTVEADGADRKFHRVRTRVKGELREGDSLVLHTLIYPSTKELQTRYSLRAWKPHLSLVRNERDGTIHLIGFCPYWDRNLYWVQPPLFALTSSAWTDDRGVALASASLDGHMISDPVARQDESSLPPESTPKDLPVGAEGRSGHEVDDLDENRRTLELSRTLPGRIRLYFEDQWGR